tara:strand:- start:638 stop:757 length:120 start_codon:yes stop_codon:yes gene_type:complete
MPMGKGTYGSKRGRPSTKKKPLTPAQKKKLMAMKKKGKK